VVISSGHRSTELAVFAHNSIPLLDFDLVERLR
jgi:hypothetical protein